MITEEQYRQALHIVQEYEYQQKVENEPDWDDDDNNDECEDCGKINCICDLVNDCTCGAWQWGNKGPVHLSDCICGGGL